MDPEYDDVYETLPADYRGLVSTWPVHSGVCIGFQAELDAKCFIYEPGPLAACPAVALSRLVSGRPAG